MTPEQQKGNEIIARYLEWELIGKYKNNKAFKTESTILKLSDMRFHSDWNVLIEVWAKVYQELMVLQESGKITEQEYLDFCCDCEDGFNMGKIEQSFSVTVQAIELINTDKTAKP